MPHTPTKRVGVISHTAILHRAPPSVTLREPNREGAAHKQRLSAEKDKSFTQRHLEAKMKINIAWYIIGGIIAIISGVWALTK